MARCYDCCDPCTKDYKVIDVRSEDGNQMRAVIHTACYERALKGGEPMYPERRIAMKDGYPQQEHDFGG